MNGSGSGSDKEIHRFHITVEKYEKRFIFHPFSAFHGEYWKTDEIDASMETRSSYKGIRPIFLSFNLSMDVNNAFFQYPS